MAYSISTHYAGQGLLDGFSFFTGHDPNNGFVNYQSREDALAKNIISIDKFNRVKLGVDSNNTYSINDEGRPSVRLTSSQGFTHGLFIADFEHMPSSTCGSWPAFWAFNDADNGDNWPMGGEVEIIEGANNVQRNLFSAHTTAGCKAPTTGFSGEPSKTDCGPTPENYGCNFAAPTSDTSSYGDTFNAEGGGVYAMEWDADALKLWHFPKSNTPEDIKLAPVVSPDPANWGPPQAIFGGPGCDADTYFYNMNLVLNINFCGDYAGNVWGVADNCNLLAPTCKEFVAGNPNAFENTFWNINYIDVYQKKGAANNVTVHPVFPNATASSLPAISNATAAPSGASPSKTRTVTISTVTQVITTSSPTSINSGLSDPSTIGDYTLLGCFGSAAGYPAFSQVATIPTMDNEACVASCKGQKYAGVYNDTCYCATTLGDAAAVSNRLCDTPCPGNGHEMCGGALEASEKGLVPSLNTTLLQANYTLAATNATLSARYHHQRRAAPPSILLTVYGDLSSSPAPADAPAKGGDTGLPATSSSVSSSTAPNTTTPPAIGGAAFFETNRTLTSAVTVTYTTICATNPALLVALEYCTTVTYNANTSPSTSPPFPAASASVPVNATTAIANAALAAVPMTTCTETCAACGARGESTVTLTVPAAVATGGADVVVTAVTVQTVVPVSYGNAIVNGTVASSSGVAAVGGGGQVSAVPVVAGARGMMAGEMGWGMMGVWVWGGVLGVVVFFL
ncbi:glycoside hydrolase family 16 protein [Whalleya microplaca]|nr:glycoside hydrolase family 16 protein [Whalleya microplaca]